ncbi:uncharacterized protein B0H64DRAFT_392073 [Chaetomium fimeti]|uniref:Uncharacterized protein n=1 Tax=Chaetomium fimeti TaxID=1854472 RepID=A0AAE0HKN6_9PEZI|nr:hypothetical protein B0H64DRAFT_392073 [Chaetomium fimeti]
MPRSDRILLASPARLFESDPPRTPGAWMGPICGTKQLISILPFTYHMNPNVKWRRPILAWCLGWCAYCVHGDGPLRPVVNLSMGGFDTIVCLTRHLCVSPLAASYLFQRPCRAKGRGRGFVIVVLYTSYVHMWYCGSCNAQNIADLGLHQSAQIAEEVKGKNGSYSVRGGTDMQNNN